jgi:hypothetical protein
VLHQPSDPRSHIVIVERQISLICETCHTLGGVFATRPGLGAWATRHGWDGDICPACLMDQDAEDRDSAGGQLRTAAP